MAPAPRNQLTIRHLMKGSLHIAFAFVFSSLSEAYLGLECSPSNAMSGRLLATYVGSLGGRCRRMNPAGLPDDQHDSIIASTTPVLKVALVIRIVKSIQASFIGRGRQRSTFDELADTSRRAPKHPGPFYQPKRHLHQHPPTPPPFLPHQ